HESYDDPAVAGIINEHFIPIKVDRDERPDLDARYQHAVSAVSVQGGWPLTGFLTPDGKVFFGGTYCPPVDAFGRPSFTRVLLSVAQYYRESRDEARDAAAQLHRQLAARDAPARPGALDPSLLAAGIDSIKRAFDPANGGFGDAPKFPHPSTIELLLRRFARTHDDALLEMVTRTLLKTARGGMHDQLGGGFHRYATDARWIVPHSEKMLYDNAGLLANYAQAFQATGHAYFAEVARDTAEFMSAVLYDHPGAGSTAARTPIPRRVTTGVTLPGPSTRRGPRSATTNSPYWSSITICRGGGRCTPIPPGMCCMWTGIWTSWPRSCARTSLRSAVCSVAAVRNSSPPAPSGRPRMSTTPAMQTG